MKKYLIFLFAMAICVSTNLYAVEKTTPEEELVPIQSSTGQLVNLDLTRALQRIDSLEREINDLERTNRYQDDRIRSLERTVSDLRRDIRG